MITKYINKVAAKVFYLLLPSLLLLSFSSCGLRKQATTESETQTAVGPAFNADSAYLFCQQQCDFGPRTMNSQAHDLCEQWIIDKFKSYGMTVIPQKCELKGYDGTTLHSTNIIASYRPELKDRILLCAHWDCRPWADNDPDEANWHKPVLAANDAASGVAVMLEIARLLNEEELRVKNEELRTKSYDMTQGETTPQQNSTTTPQQGNHNSSLFTLNSSLGLDFICFDAEDYGFPQWETIDDPGNTWALGSKYWAGNLHTPGYKARYGILLDMVGGQGAQFYQESMSKYYAKHIVDKVWQAAAVVGYGSFFPMAEGGGVTDDHIPVNTVANIPCIDIIPHYPNCEQSSFGPTWHTLNDDMAHIDKNTLLAVGQTIIQVLFSEK